MARRRTQLIERMRRAGYAPIMFSDGEEAGMAPFDPDAIAQPSDSSTNPDGLTDPLHPAAPTQ